MQFKVSEDVDAPADGTWARFTDFPGFETEIRERGIELARAGPWEVARPGCGWRGTVELRGRERPLTSEIVALEPPERLEISSRIGGVDARYVIRFLALRPDMTRVNLALDLSATTLSARLALQSLKLARGKILQRLQGLLARQGNLAEEDWRRARG